MEKTENAVTEALGRAHSTLLADLGKLEQAVGLTSWKDLEQLRTQLAATHAHVAEHFRFEEQNGYMDVVRKREPRLERAVGQLAREHDELRMSLDLLLGEVKAATRLDEPLREAIRKWIGRVREHEDRENKLVQNAFNLDIGAED